MLNVFSARTEILEIASQKPYKFKTQKMCQLECNKSENIKHLTNCNAVKDEEQEKPNHEVFANVMSVELKSNINQLIQIIERINIKIR